MHTIILFKIIFIYKQNFTQTLINKIISYSKYFVKHPLLLLITDSVSAAQATACAKAFCNRVKELGYTPIIYSPSKELYFKYDLTQLADFDIWYCEYANVPTFYYQFSMWQYSSSGKVDGIEGDVDMNICFTNIADYD